MSIQAESRNTGEKTLKKAAGKESAKSGKSRDAFYKISEHSLREFLDDEPDLYTVADIKVRYQ